MAGANGELAQARVARLACVIVAALLAANLLFNLAAGAAGVGMASPARFFMMRLDQAFDDYFMFVLSYPGGQAISPSVLPWLAERTGAALATDPGNPYVGLSGLQGPGVTHLFVPPLTTLFCLANVAAMQVVDAGLLFLALVAGLLTYGWRIVLGVAIGREERSAWLGLGLLCYPMLFMLTRGNVYAGATALLVVHAMLLCVRGEKPAMAALLLAVAVNIRPNAIVFAVPLLVLGRHGLRACLLLGGTAALLFGASLAAAHLLYPEYTLATFLAGLGAYYRVYVTGGEGLAYGSSLFGGLRLLFGRRAGLDLIALLPVAGIVAAGAVLRHRLAGSSVVFLTAAGYAAASTVFGDYHLLVFAAVPMAVAIEAARTGWVPRAGWIVLGASCLVLAPKNYLYSGPVSWQALLNPVILLAASGAVLLLAARGARAPVGEVARA